MIELTTLEDVWAQLRKDPEFAETEKQLRPLFQIGYAILRLRLNRGLSVRELARDSGLSYATVANVEDGTGNPTIRTLQKIASALGTELNLTLNEH